MKFSWVSFFNNGHSIQDLYYLQKILSEYHSAGAYDLNSLNIIGIEAMKFLESYLVEK